MRLGDLAAALDLPLDGAAPAADVEVTGVTHRADWARPGDAFVAIRGHTVDGHRFIGGAVERGAVAVLGEGLPEGVTCPVPYVVVPAARAALADAAAELAGHPSRAMQVLGVTGTDGKTTSSCLARHLLRHAGQQTGLLSTIGYELPDRVLRQPPTHFTTPEAPQVQQILAEEVQAGAEVVVVEASSHALALDRVRAVDFDVAVWTNLTGEHLDFHGSMEAYFADKATLVQRARHSVLNADDPWFDQLVPMAAELTTYSVDGADADWTVSEVVETADELRFTVHSPEGTAPAVLPMIGRFNVANALAAMAAAHRMGVGLASLVSGLATFTGVPGRMEMVERAVDEPRVIVDFAHTAPSLEKALETLRVTTTGRLWVVLGSAGGPRDPSKRAPLGEAATRLADRVVFTEEDHRDTPLREILAEMERGATAAGRDNFVSIGDRRDAIAHATLQADPADTVLLAGKGPETTLERDTTTIRWDEMSEARAALVDRRAVLAAADEQADSQG